MFGREAVESVHPDHQGAGHIHALKQGEMDIKAIAVTRCILDGLMKLNFCRASAHLHRSDVYGGASSASFLQHGAVGNLQLTCSLTEPTWFSPGQVKEKLRGCY